MVQQTKRFLVRTDFAKLDVSLDFAAVKFAIKLCPAVLDLFLGLLLCLLRGHCSFAPSNLNQLRGVQFGQTSPTPRRQPNCKKTDPCAHDKSARERPTGRIALGHQIRKCRCAD